MKFIVRVLGNMAGLWLSTQFIAGIFIPLDRDTTRNLLALAVIAAVLTLVNSIVRPLMKILSFPLYILTFGLFALVVNGLTLLLTGWITQQIGWGLEVAGLQPAVLGGFLIAFVSSVIVSLLGGKK